MGVSRPDRTRIEDERASLKKGPMVLLRSPKCAKPPRGPVKVPKGHIPEWKSKKVKKYVCL